MLSGFSIQIVNKRIHAITNLSIMSKYIVSIILVSSVLTGLNMIPAITSNFTAQEQLKLDRQRPWEVIARADQTDEDNITAGEERDR